MNSWIKIKAKTQLDKLNEVISIVKKEYGGDFMKAAEDIAAASQNKVSSNIKTKADVVEKALNIALVTAVAALLNLSIEKVLQDPFSAMSQVQVLSEVSSIAQTINLSLADVLTEEGAKKLYTKMSSNLSAPKLYITSDGQVIGVAAASTSDKEYGEATTRDGAENILKDETTVNRNTEIKTFSFPNAIDPSLSSFISIAYFPSFKVSSKSDFNIIENQQLILLFYDLLDTILNYESASEIEIIEKNEQNKKALQEIIDEIKKRNLYIEVSDQVKDILKEQGIKI